MAVFFEFHISLILFFKFMLCSFLDGNVSQLNVLFMYIAMVLNTWILVKIFTVFTILKKKSHCRQSWDQVERHKQHVTLYSLPSNLIKSSLADKSFCVPGFFFHYVFIIQSLQTLLLLARPSVPSFFSFTPKCLFPLPTNKQRFPAKNACVSFPHDRFCQREKKKPREKKKSLSVDLASER